MAYSCERCNRSDCDGNCGTVDSSEIERFIEGRDA